MILSKERHIAHLDIDTFFVSVEQLKNPTLRGKPVLIGGSTDRAVVASCNREARQFGIYSGISMRAALRLCRHAIVIKSDYEAYSKYSALLTDVIRDSVPLFEKSSIDEFYIDLTGMDKYFGCRLFTEELKKKLNRESGLPLSYGIASNKLVSKVATNEVKPNGQLEIPFGQEKTFLAPLSILKIPGIGKETGFKLYKMGVDTVKVLSEIPLVLLQNLLGKNGLELWKRAQGIDESPVVPYREQKSLSTEKTFQADTTDIQFLNRELVRMTEKLGFELRQQDRLTGCVVLKLKYTDHETHTLQQAIPYTNADDILLKLAKSLLTRLYQRRVLVRLIGIRFTDLIPGTYQINLFEDTNEKISLYQAIDSVKKRFGENLLVRAV